MTDSLRQRMQVLLSLHRSTLDRTRERERDIYISWRKPVLEYHRRSFKSVITIVEKLSTHRMDQKEMIKNVEI